MSESNDRAEPTQPDMSGVKSGPGSEPTTGATPVETGAPAKAGGKPPRAAEPERDTVQTIHYRLSYVVRNRQAGPRGAVVLLHDLPGGAFTWADMQPPLDGTNRAIYAFDMLGYGESDHPWPSDTSVWGHADSLEYALRALRLSDIVLVGVGLGAGVAQVLATRLYREWVAKLVLINSYAYEYAFAPNWPLPEMEKRQDPEAPKHTKLDQMVADLRATVPQASTNPKYLAGSALDAYVHEWNSELGKEMLFQHIRLMIPNYMNSISSQLRKLEVPTLLIWGEQDQVTPLSLGQRLQREIPNARLETVANAGHLILDDAPGVVGRLVADFAGVPSASEFAVTQAR
jgi:pimeloyl-ACP methyl ester carboxylesterase